MRPPIQRRDGDAERASERVVARDVDGGLGVGVALDDLVHAVVDAAHIAELDLGERGQQIVSIT